VGEKTALASAAQRANLNVSQYIRTRLFGRPQLSDSDQILVDGLAQLKPRFDAALANIDANLREIAALRQAAQRAGAA